MFRKEPSIEERLLMLAQRCRSAAELCALVADSLLDKPITIVPEPELLSKAPGAAIQLDGHFFILYKPTSRLTQELSILHELAHISLGHLDDVQRPSDPKEILEGKTYFTDRQEWAAERMGHLMMAAILFPTETSPISARYAQLMPSRLSGFSVENLKPTDPLPALRYRALMAWE